MSGHSNPWEYGWTFFEVALNELEKQDMKSIRQTAIAARAGYHADKKGWKKFIDELK